MEVDNENDLAKAINNNQDMIIIKGNLGKRVITIIATKRVAWLIAIGSVSVAVIAVLKVPVVAAGGPPALATDGIVATTAAGAAVSIWGVSATVAAISICAAGRSVKTLKKLYNGYSIVSKGEGYVRLKRK